MNTEVQEILVDLAQRLINEREMWENAFGNGEPTEEATTAYRELCNNNEVVRTNAIPKLIALGHKVYTIMISGTAPTGVHHYELEGKVAERFGDRVLCDCESSIIWIMTTPEDQDEVLAYIRELAGSGEVHYYDGAVEQAEVNAYPAVVAHINGLTGMTAKKFLKENSND